MAVRRNILDAIRDDFLAITTDNGYNNTISGFAYTNSDLLNLIEADLDYVWLFSLPETNLVGESFGEWVWEIGYAVYFKTEGLDADASGLMEEKAESYLEDIKNKFLEPTNAFANTNVQSIALKTIDPFLNEDSINVGIVYGSILVTYTF